MQIIILRCGANHVEVPAEAHTARVVDVSTVPSRAELRVLDEAAAAILPEDPTPSLDEISARPDAQHLGTPAPAPQPVPEALRVVVVGTDAALSAVLTRMMRADYMWVEVGYVPLEVNSAAAKNWGLPAATGHHGEHHAGHHGDTAEAFRVALTGAVRPVPLIRNDAGLAVAGSASISDWSNGTVTGEIIVDDAVMIRGEGSAKERGLGDYGVRLVPMLDAPGIVAAKATSQVAPDAQLGVETPATGFFGKLFSKAAEPGQLDPGSVATGRAVQAGGPALRVIVDGVSGKRAVKASTFYRHLRDLQVVRP